MLPLIYNNFYSHIIHTHLAGYLNVQESVYVCLINGGHKLVLASTHNQMLCLVGTEHEARDHSTRGIKSNMMNITWNDSPEQYYYFYLFQ